MKTFEQLNIGDSVYVNGSSIHKYDHYEEEKFIISELKVTNKEIITSEKHIFKDCYDIEEYDVKCYKLELTFDNHEFLDIDIEENSKYKNCSKLYSGQGVCNFISTSYDETLNEIISIIDRRISSLENSIKNDLEQIDKLKIIKSQLH